jgi:sugar/nucleoside kinase (ribokinase family)
MHRDNDLLVIGDVNADLVLRGQDPMPQFGQVEKLVDSGVLTIGGSSGITACAAARLGLRTACLGILGDDPLGAVLRSGLAARGVDASRCLVDPTRATGITVILTVAGSGDRAMLTATGTLDSLTAVQVDRDLLRRSRHLHCGAYFLQPGLQEGLAALFDEARAAGVTCSLDTNWDPSGRWDGGLAACLERCDFFFPNEAEALHITGAADVDAAATRLAASVPVVAIKRGAAGAMVRSGKRTLCAGAPRVEIVDTTGAGDAFDAGYIYGFLHDWPVERCLAFAVACGSLSTRAAGGVLGQAELAEAVALAEHVRVEER